MKGVFYFSIGVISLLLNSVCCTFEEEPSHPSQKDNSKCGLFLAPSSIPNSGLGMFAGHYGIKEDSVIGDGDVIIPFFEMEFHNKRKDERYDAFLWDEYVWAPKTFVGAEQETNELETVEFACPGIGSAANSYLALRNVFDHGVELGLGTDPGSPGAGAHSPYHNRYFTATEDIPPGGEVWMDYGPAYFETRVKEYGYIPLPENYPDADELLISFQEMRSFDCTQVTSNHTWDALYQTVLDFAPIWKTSRILHALPQHANQILDLLQDGGTTYRDYDASRRDLDWLDEHGQCMDNIKTGMSQESPHVGRGALANRFIPKGGLVTPAPLIHIGDLDVLKMYQRTKIWSKDRWRSVPDMKGPFTYQLILNYCFGHRDSTVLLCPYGLLTALINHSSKNANTRIVWSDTMRRKEWLNMPIDEFAEQEIAGLQIDFVALRDIEEDEEILIDYGDEWEEAWQEHMQTYQPREGYIPAYELNKRLNEMEFRTLEERPYSEDGIQLKCRIQNVTQCLPSKSPLLKKDSVACGIVEKLNDNQYTVKILEEDGAEDHPLLMDVPFEAFFFVDLPYQRHHFSFDAFRHAMMIPDDMFPEVWKNRQDEEEDERILDDEEIEDSSDDDEDAVDDYAGEEEYDDKVTERRKKNPNGWKEDPDIIELPDAT